MPDILDHHSSETTKLFAIGRQGNGKTGMLASLAAVGYKLRILDFDNGTDILKNLLTQDYYPYKSFMEKNKIPLRGAILTYTITEEMIKHRSEDRFIPKSAKGWGKMVSMLENWKEGEINLGPIESWGSDTVLVFDTFATCSDLAYNYIQELNGRLGARQEGYDYQRDVGGAQGILKNLIQKIFNPIIKCNAIFNSHITFVDESRGTSERPRVDGVVTDPTGYPQAIGRALSPVVGKYFNSTLLIDQTGSGQSAKHEICTVPMKGVSVKNANPGGLKAKYSIESGLAEIFAALRGEPEPKELMEMCLKSKPQSTTPASTSRSKSNVMTLDQILGK